MKNIDKLKASSNPLDFFHISTEIFEDRRIFPFHIYVFHPVTKVYTMFLPGNCPLVKDKWDLLAYIQSKGGEIAVRKDQQHTFLSSLQKKENEIPSLAMSPTPDASKLDFLKSQKAAKAALQNDKINFQDDLQKCVIENNFAKMIERTRNEVLAFPCTISHTVSLARYLVQELLYEDNLYNRIVSLSFHLAKNMGFLDEESLSSLVCAAYFHHLGFTQIDLQLLRRPWLEIVDEDRKKYRQHPGLTQHLITKFKLNVAPLCFQIMQDHHERTNGSGFPNFKQGNSIEALGLALGAVSHILEYHYGLVTGKKTPLPDIFINLKNRSSMPGLEFEFGPMVYQNLIHILNVQALKDVSQEKAA